MCGRCVLLGKAKKMAAYFKISFEKAIELALVENLPRHALAPSQPAPFFRLSQEGKPELAQLKWGLLPAVGAGRTTAPDVAERASRCGALRSSTTQRCCGAPANRP